MNAHVWHLEHMPANPAVRPEVVGLDLDTTPHVRSCGIVATPATGQQRARARLSDSEVMQPTRCGASTHRTRWSAPGPGPLLVRNAGQMPDQRCRTREPPGPVARCSAARDAAHHSSLSAGAAVRAAVGWYGLRRAGQ